MRFIDNKYFRRVTITLLLLAGAWFIRELMVPGLPFYQHILATIAFAVLIQIIWEIFERTHNFLNKWPPFSRFLYSRIVVQLLIGIVFLLGVRLITIILLKDKLPFELDNITTSMMLVANIGLAITINMVFISGHFIMRWKEQIVRVESVQKEKAQMQYHHLKNQINPHFLFNALTSLDALVKSNPELASQYINHLSKVYRYVLEHKENEVVNVQTELDFIHHYVSLQKIRFGNGLVVDIRISNEASEKGIVMVTLQMLIDNAIKHNEIHNEHALIIQVYDDGDTLIIKNNKQKKELLAGMSTQHGLKQLTELYAYLCKRPMKILNESHYFTIEIPLL